MVDSNLIGKNSIELVAMLPQFSWSVFCSHNPNQEFLYNIYFAYYDITKTEDTQALYWPLDVSKGMDLGELARVTSWDNRTIGLLSKVDVIDTRYASGHRPAHIPMLDFDMEKNFGYLPEKEILELLKIGIRDTLKLQQGVLLKSGPYKNYHYVGTGHLLSEDDFITFLGLSLTLRHPDKEGVHRHLVDCANVGHILTPLDYLRKSAEPWSEPWSPYDFRERFGTLRIGKKEGYPSLPYVVAIL